MKGDVPVSHRATVDHRVGTRRTEAGLDPRLPHGRAGDHLLRPRTAQRVPRRPGGHGRRHPGRPRRRRDHRRRRARTRRRRRRSRRSRPAGSTRSSTARSSTTPAAGSASTRCTTPRASRSSRPNGSSSDVAASRANSLAPRRCSPAARRSLHHLPLRGRQAELAASSRRKRLEVERALDLRRALRALHRVRGDLPGRQPHDDLGRPRRRPTGPTFNFDPRSVDWPTYITEIHLPSIIQHARVKTTPGPVARHRPHGAHAQAGARPEAPGRRVRPREHADRLERRRELLVARDTPPRHARADPLRAAHDGRGAGPAEARSSATAPTSCATSTVATRTPRSSRSRRTPASC